MKRKNENLDDVVFDERNKNYGAYFLRRSYNKNVACALFLATFFILGIISIPLIAGLMNKGRNLNIEGDVTIFEPIPEPPVKEPLPDLPKQQPLIEKIKPFIFVVVDSTIIEDASSLMELADNTGNEQPPDITDDGTLIIDDTKKNVIIDQTKEQAFVAVQEMPDFIGGIEKMYAYLHDNTKYPQIALDNGISGKVHVKFVVETDGSISNITLLNDIGGGCGEEAVRVVSSMPKWKPGKQNGIQVRVWFVLPVHFKLEQ